MRQSPPTTTNTQLREAIRVEFHGIHGTQFHASGYGTPRCGLSLISPSSSSSVMPGMPCACWTLSRRTRIANGGEPAHLLHQGGARAAAFPRDQSDLPVPRHPPLHCVLAPFRGRDQPHDRPAPGPAGGAGPPLRPLRLQEDPALSELPARDRVDVLVDRLSADGAALSVGRARRTILGLLASSPHRPGATTL